MSTMPTLNVAYRQLAPHALESVRLNGIFGPTATASGLRDRNDPIRPLNSIPAAVPGT